MFRVLFCTALMGLTQVQPISGDKCQCGVVSDDIVSMRIVGGRKAAPHAFPWAVAILKMDFLHCGGALITDRHVLSAGHCFEWDHLKLLSMLAGLSNLDHLDGVEKRTFSNAIVHENFSSTATRDDNDIAITVLSSPVTFGDTIKPVCLPRPFQQFGNYAGTIVGWGRLGEDEPASKDLLQAKLNILSDDKCTSSVLKEHLTVNMMCATAKGIDGCQGDSGGPLVVFDPSGRYIQAGLSRPIFGRREIAQRLRSFSAQWFNVSNFPGVTSWGIGCADPRFPGVYTKVSYYIDWIKKNTADGKTCNKS